MTFRPPPAPPPPTPASVALLRAVGDLLRATGAERIALAELAAALGRDPLGLPAMVRRSIAAGYLVAVSTLVGLSVQGWAWYEWDRRQRTP